MINTSIHVLSSLLFNLCWLLLLFLLLLLDLRLLFLFLGLWFLLLFGLIFFGLLLLLGLLFFSQEGVLRGRIFNQETVGLFEIFKNLRQILDMLVPTEQVIVLNFLFVRHLQHVVVKLGEHEKVSKSYMTSHEESTGLQMFLQMLSKIKSTLRSSFPSFSCDFISEISVDSSPSPKKKLLH